MLRQIPGDEITAEDVKDDDRRRPRAASSSAIGHGYDCSKPSWPGTTACGTGVIFTKITADRRRSRSRTSPSTSAGPPGQLSTHPPDRQEARRRS